MVVEYVAAAVAVAEAGYAAESATLAAAVVAAAAAAVAVAVVAAAAVAREHVVFARLSLGTAGLTPAFLPRFLGESVRLPD